MTGNWRNTIAVGVASYLAMLPVLQLSSDLRLLLGSLLVIAGLQTVVGLLRHRWPDTPGTLVQLGLWIVTVLIACWVVGEREEDDPRWQPIVDVAQQAARQMSEQSAPMTPGDPTLVVLLAAIGLLTIVTDAIFVAARNVLLALLPLLAGYISAMVVLDDPVAIWSFVVVVLAWLVLLASRTIDHERRWPRGLVRGEQLTLNMPSFLNLAAWLGVPALTLALLAGMAVSTEERDWLPGGAGGGTVQLTDPSIQLNENLRRPEERPVISYITTAPGGVLLRSSALTLVDAGGWRQIDMSLQAGFPNRVPGLPSTAKEVTTQVTIGEFSSNYLPAPYAPIEWDAEGTWDYDPASLTVLNVDRDRDADALANTSYTVLSRSAEPTAEQIRFARAGSPPDGVAATEVPEGVPQVIVDLAQQITAEADTDGLRAVALQDWLRDPTQFSYDLAAPEGTGFDALVNFLTVDRRGYCVHYASSMALMARTLGIPSRVAIGFTAGELQPDGSWLVTSHNMHAWPELYFSSLGWVRFEPTVSVGSPPAWTDVPDPNEEPTPSASPTPTQGPTPSLEPDEPSEEPLPLPGESAGATPIDLRWPLGILGALLVLALPGLARTLQRRARLGRGEPRALVAGAWQELEATAIDLGLTWPDATPRQTAAASWPELDADGRAALRRVALLTERLHYAPALPAEVAVADDVRTISTQWRTGSTNWTRLWSRVAPRSLLMG